MTRLQLYMATALHGYSFTWLQLQLYTVTVVHGESYTVHGKACGISRARAGALERERTDMYFRL